MNHDPYTAELEGAPPIPAIGDVIAQKYRVSSVVGTGGMGVVLAATHLGLGQSVAIKVLMIPEDDTRRDEARERFLREGRATAALVSDHVVRVYDVGTLENGAPFMVMELLRGRDLAVVLQQNGALPIEHAADYVRQAAEAIGCAHAQGIVHRDLKPSNLFLTQRSDGTPLIKVLDFGISKTTQSALDPVTGNLTAARSVLGTPFYMSPEQIRDAKQVDFRTDIWSLGLILHELLSGSPAFEGTTLPGVCAAIAADPPAALRLKRPEVSIELEAIVLKCLEKEPAKRFQDVRDLALKLVSHSGRQDSSALVPLSDKTIRSSPLTLGISELRDSATLSVAASNDAGTMASAVLAKSGERVVARATPPQAKEQQTLSAAPTTAPTPTLDSETRRTSSARRSLVLVAGSVTLLVVIGVWALQRPSATAPVVVAVPAPAPQPSVVPPTLASSFSLEISASQAGAQVFEGDNLLGPAPLRITIDSASVSQTPRTFTVRKSGYAPYTLVQGASHVDAHVLAELAPLPVVPAKLPARVQTKRTREVKSAPAQPKPASPPPDIFMQR